MKKRSRIIWIDDNPGRAATATELHARFVNAKNKNLGPEIEKLLSGEMPRLLIIDHVLDKTAADTHPLFQKGSTIAEAIKEKWPSCPVVGVTNADLIADIDLRTKETYDALFSFQDFGNYIGRIRNITKGFALISEGRPPKVKQVIKLLKPPDDDIPRLEEALATDLKWGAQDASVASRLFRWVNALIARPGFLLDDLWAATYLGLNAAGFAKVAANFERAKYSGIFLRPDEPRWWASRLAEILYRVAPAESGELSWHAGRRLPGIKREHFSVCYYCEEEFPETVAYLDEASEERRAMHLKCTVLHPRYKRELYFEDIRMMLGK